MENYPAIAILVKYGKALVELTVIISASLLPT